MKGPKGLLVLLVFLSTSTFLQAQISEIEKSETLLRQHPKKDTTRVNLLNNTALQLNEVDDERMLELAKEAIELSGKLRFPKGEAEGLRITGIFHYNRSENLQALENFQNALEINQEFGYQKGSSLSLNNIGRVNWRLGDYSMAQENFEQAYAIAEQLGDKEIISKCLSSFGVLNIQQGNYEEALEYLQKSLKGFEEFENKKAISACLQNIGYIHMRQGNYPEAIEYFQKVISIMEDMGDKKGASGSYLNSGIIYQNQGDFNKAIEYYLKAKNIYEEFGDRDGVSMCLNNIGLIYESQGNYPKALEYIQNSLKIKEEMSDKRMISSCLMNIGGIHANQGDFPLAFEYFQRSLQILEEMQDNPGISNCLLSLGNAYGKQGNYALALESFYKSLEIKKEIGDKYGISNCLRYIGNMHELKEEDSQALEYYMESLELKEELEDKAGLCLLYLDMGKVFLKTNKHSRALEFSHASLELAMELDLLDVQSKIHKQLSDIYVANNNYDLALENLVQHKELHDSIFSEEKIRRIAGLEFQYKQEKDIQVAELEQQKKDAILAEEAKRQKILRNYLILGILLMVLFVLLVLFSFFQKRKANHILGEQKREIEDKNKELTESIQYAKRIQSALFPPDSIIKNVLPNYFILHKPRDIVSGDYYWMTKKDGKVIVAIADCTGHGVPGAFMSMLGIAYLCELVNKTKIVRANGVLNQLRGRIIHLMHQTGRKDEARDGMEMALCIIDLEQRTVQYSGAFRPLYLVKSHELIEVKADKMPIGIYEEERHSFTNQQEQLDPGDCIYLFTDGFVDQTGGPRKKSFKSRYFKKLLLQIHDKEMDEQKNILDRTIEEWRGDIEQIDDILVLGIKV